MDKLGDRIKQDFEDRTRFLLPRRTYGVLRLDGKAFHTYTKGCQQPFDAQLMQDMDQTAIAVCEQVQGAKIAFVQSDEITVVFTDFDTVETHQWFNGNIQKISSVSASMATAYFNQLRASYGKLAFFDARVFAVPIRLEVFNTLLWRQIDAAKNSVQMVARHYLGHKICQGQSTQQLKDLLRKNQTPWENCPRGFQQGRIIIKETYQVAASEKTTKKGIIQIPEHQRTRWVAQDAFDFRETEKLALLIPNLPE